MHVARRKPHAVELPPRISNLNEDLSRCPRQCAPVHVFLAILRPHDARDDVNRDEGIHPITRDDGSVEKALTRAPVPHPPCHPVLHAATVPARCDIRPGRANYDRRMRLEGLTPHQEDLVNRWWPDAALVADLSWPEALTRVLHLRSRRGDVVVKAGGDVTRHHITREIAAGEQVHGDGLPQLLAADNDAHLLLLAYQSGTLVQDTPAQDEPAVYRACGALLKSVHCQAHAMIDTAYPQDRLNRLRRLLPQAEPLLDGATHRHLTAAIEGVTVRPEPRVPTHGDFQPRNWLVEGEPARAKVALIDFGRFAWRPWYSDLVRLFHALPPEDPRLLATLDGLDREPPWLLDAESTQAQGWAAENLFQAVATVVWATQVDALPFADHGRLMLERCLASR